MAEILYKRKREEGGVEYADEKELTLLDAEKPKKTKKTKLETLSILDLPFECLVHIARFVESSDAPWWNFTCRAFRDAVRHTRPRNATFTLLWLMKHQSLSQLMELLRLRVPAKYAITECRRDLFLPFLKYALTQEGLNLKGISDFRHGDGVYCYNSFAKVKCFAGTQRFLTQLYERIPDGKEGEEMTLRLLDLYYPAGAHSYNGARFGIIHPAARWGIVRKQKRVITKAHAMGLLTGPAIRKFVLDSEDFKFVQWFYNRFTEVWRDPKQEIIQVLNHLSQRKKRNFIFKFLVNYYLEHDPTRLIMAMKSPEIYYAIDDSMYFYYISKRVERQF